MTLSDRACVTIHVICIFFFIIGLNLIAIGGTELTFPYKCPSDTFFLYHYCRYINLTSTDYVYDNNRYTAGLIETIIGSILLAISIIVPIKINWNICRNRCMKVKPKPTTNI
jgi:hypothetical protein